MQWGPESGREHWTETAFRTGPCDHSLARTGTLLRATVRRPGARTGYHRLKYPDQTARRSKYSASAMAAMVVGMSDAVTVMASRRA